MGFDVVISNTDTLMHILNMLSSVTICGPNGRASRHDFRV